LIGHLDFEEGDADSFFTYVCHSTYGAYSYAPIGNRHPQFFVEVSWSEQRDKTAVLAQVSKATSDYIT